MSMLTPLDSRQNNCPHHGEYTSKLYRIAGRQVWSSCPSCSHDCPEIAAEKAAADAERRAAELRELIGRVGIPPRFENRRLESFRADTDEQRKALEVMTRYADEFDDVLRTGRSLILCGPPGTGKTHLAIGVAWRVLGRGMSAGFISAMNAIRAIRESYRSESRLTERESIRRFAAPDLLILDEVGQQRGTDDERVLMTDLVNARYEAVRPMIVISNLNVDGVRSYLGDRAFDRLREGGGRAVQCEWESYRKQI
jgi:DNA replication protein DnaC